MRANLVHEAVGVVGGYFDAGIAYPVVIEDVGALAHIHERHKVAALVEIVALVGYPHLDAGDVDTRRHDGELGGKLVVVVAEEMPEEEVPVLVVVVDID